MQKKIPLRRCCGCGEMKPKKELIRVVRTNQGSAELDFTGKAAGRGAYVCENEECLKKAVKNGGLSRTLAVSVPEQIYKNLEGRLKDAEK